MQTPDLFRLVHARPFRPFAVHLPGGRTVVVKHPDYIMRNRRGDVVRIVTVQNTVTFDPATLVAVTDPQGPLN